MPPAPGGRDRPQDAADREPSRFPPSPRETTPRGNFAVYRIALSLPKDRPGYVATHGRPELRVELHNRMELANGHILIEGRVLGPGALEVADRVKDLPAVVEFEVHPESDRSVFFQITIRPPRLLTIIQQHRILTRYPIVLVDGWMRFETLAPANQIRRLVKDLTRDVGPSRVEAVRQGSVTPSVLGLSPSQQAVFREALAAGYFGSPRRISLTQLARRLGRSKSTVSEQMALIQRRLAESALRLKWDPIEVLG